MWPIRECPHSARIKQLHYELRSGESVRMNGYLDLQQVQSAGGLLHKNQIKNGFGSGEAMVVLVTNGPEFPEGKELAKLLAADFPALKSVVQNINTSSGNVVLGEKNKVLYGADGIIDRLGELELKISATSFSR